jgi:hypothetical protein
MAALQRGDKDAADHLPAVFVDFPVLECECTDYSDINIRASSCREGGEVYFLASVRQLSPWFVYELEIKWSLESDQSRHTWNSVVTTDTNHYSFREPLLQREERNDDFLFGMKTWNLYKKGNARFVIEVTVCDVHPGLTTEEALIGIRNMDSTAASVRLKCNDMESLAPPLPLPVYAQDVEALRVELGDSARVVCLSFERFGAGSDEPPVRGGSFAEGGFFKGEMFQVLDQAAVYGPLFGRKAMLDGLGEVLEGQEVPIKDDPEAISLLALLAKI